MKVLIVYCHPYEKSFNHALLESIRMGVQDAGDIIEVIDLVRDGFNPVFSAGELALFSQGKFLDEKIGEYQMKIQSADHLVFLYPYWWGGMPAILKGFFDKVFLPGWAYHETPEGRFIGHLKQIKSATMLITMSMSGPIFKLIFESAVKRLYFLGGLGSCGIRKIMLKTLNGVDKVPDRKREIWLKKIRNWAGKIGRIK
jgi:NAD(P)H dehydrogenase (quinone)